MLEKILGVKQEKNKVHADGSSHGKNVYQEPTNKLLKLDTLLCFLFEIESASPICLQPPPSTLMTLPLFPTPLI